MGTSSGPEKPTQNSDERDPLDLLLEAAYETDPMDVPYLEESVLAVLNGSSGSGVRVQLREVRDSSQKGEESTESRDEDERTDGAGRTGRYEIVDEIARGGLGVVMRSRDADIGRDVAMKLLKDRHSGNPALIRRLVIEAQICGQLQHPSIVPVYEMGISDDQRPFFTMKLVKGKTLAALLRGRQDLSSSRIRYLRIFEQVCQAMAYAHARGVIHRDLKPSNIMVGAFGEVQLMDWGLAKVLGREEYDGSDGEIIDGDRALKTIPPSSDSDCSEAGSVMGTYGFMPPEQARGEVDLLDERCDVFGLGAVLCDILTGKPAFVGDQRDAIQQQAREGNLDECWARLDESDADPKLKEVAKKCLAPAIADRPRDAGEVAGLIESYLGDVAEQARRAEIEATESRVRLEEAEARISQERRARRLGFVLAAVVVVAVTAGSLLYFWYSGEQQEQRSRVAGTVNAALAEAISKSGEAKASTDLGDRREAWQQTLFMGRRAQDIFNQSSLDDSTLRKRIEQLISEAKSGETGTATAISRATADRDMVDRLESIRIQAGGDWNWAAMDSRFTAAFRDYGIDIDELGAEAASALIRESAVSRELVSAVHEWWDARSKTGGDMELLAQIVSHADPDPWRFEVRQAFNSGDRERTIELANALDPAIATPADVYFMTYALHPHDEQATVDLLTEALHHHPEDYWLNFRLGWICCKPSRAMDSIGYYSTACALRPKSDAAWCNLGFAYWHGGFHKKAQRAFEKALEIDPDDPVGLGSYAAFVLHQLRDPDEAFKLLTEALKIDPNDAQNHAAMGDLYAHFRGDFAMAWIHYDRAAELAPRRVDVLGNLAWICMNTGDFDEAVTRLEEALEIDPNNALNHSNLGVSLEQLGQLDDAADSYQRVLDLEPKNVDAWFYLGRVRIMLEEWEEADRCFEEVLKINPAHATAQEALEWVREHM